MVFKRGEVVNPGGKPGDKAFREAIRTLIFQPAPPKGDLVGPRGKTCIQKIVIANINNAMKGNLEATKWLSDKLDGKMGLGDGEMPPIETPAIQDRDITLREAARRIGYLLLAQVPPEEPTIIDN